MRFGDQLGVALEIIKRRMEAIESRNCSALTDIWDERWNTCPICGCFEVEGVWVHRDPEHLVN